MSKFKKFLKTKAGFTLVELIVAFFILGILSAIAIPVYNGIQKQNRTKVCKVTMQKVESDIRVWAMQYPYNAPFAFTIHSGKSGTTLGPAPEEGYPDLIPETKKLILNDVFKCIESDVLSCPCEDGVYTVVLTENEKKTYCNVEVFCSGDNGAHNS